MNPALHEFAPEQLVESLLAVHEGESEWLDEFSEALERRRAGLALRRILSVWGLSQSDAARRFQVSRQAVSKWLQRGVSSDRVEAVADLAAATDLLVRHLKRDRISAVVRRSATALGGDSLLDLVGADRPHDVLAACRMMFDFERAVG